MADQTAAQCVDRLSGPAAPSLPAFDRSDFSKSLLIDTIGELFAGHEPLFRGLALHPHSEWSVRYPVIRLSFGGGALRSRDEMGLRIGGVLDAMNNLISRSASTRRSGCWRSKSSNSALKARRLGGAHGGHGRSRAAGAGRGHEAC